MRKYSLYLSVACLMTITAITTGECSEKTRNSRATKAVNDPSRPGSIVDPLVKDLSSRDLAAERSRDNNASISGKEVSSDNGPETADQYGSMVANIFTMR
ncbi:MAG: hypothetical protein GF392_02980 [Candidatus Omnitrophica bacterium]|nr:hypothetical protein [Candidatus Omnitrophota bacterium]